MKYATSGLIEQVHFPPISEVKKWVSSLPPNVPLVDLCQAVPDYPPAPELAAHLAELVLDPQVARYSPDEGMEEVRESVCARYRRTYEASIKADQICLTIGASQAFWLALITLCRAGDEVIVQVPYYFDHAMALEMLGVKAVFLPYREEEKGIPSAAVVAALITERTKAVLLVSPSNPTGVVTPPEILAEIFGVARKRRIALIIDETYSEFIPGGGTPHRLFTDGRWSDTFVHITSFGKTYALTGYRAGLLAASADFIHHALKVQDTMAVCQPRITQHAVKFGVENLDDWVAANRAMMERRHDLFKMEFTSQRNTFRLISSGAFFAWVRHPCAGSTGRAVARRLVEEAGLLTLPGEVFGPGLEPYLRLAFGNISEATIPEAVRRFRNFTS